MYTQIIFFAFRRLFVNIALHCPTQYYPYFRRANLEDSPLLSSLSSSYYSISSITPGRVPSFLNPDPLSDHIMSGEPSGKGKLPLYYGEQTANRDTVERPSTAINDFATEPYPTQKRLWTMKEDEETPLFDDRLRARKTGLVFDDPLPYTDDKRLPWLRWMASPVKNRTFRVPWIERRTANPNRFCCYYWRICWNDSFPVLCIRGCASCQHAPRYGRLRPHRPIVHLSLLWIQPSGKCVGFLPDLWRFIQSRSK